MNTMWWLLVVVVVAAAAAGGCATVPKRATDPVTLGDWCDTVAATMCRTLIERCASGGEEAVSACRDKFEPECLAGRPDKTMLKRTNDELTQCQTFVRSLACKDLDPSVASRGDALCAPK
jgi:hypothetical protein